MAMILVGAQKRITLTWMNKGERKARSITFWPKSRKHPNRINKCPEEIWQRLLAKKGGLRYDNEERRSPLEEYLQAGILWQITGAQAQLIHEGKRPLMSPLGPEAGHINHSPKEPTVDDLTPGQRMLMDRIIASDPQFSEVDLGEVPDGQVQPPPPATPQPNPLFDPDFASKHS